MADSLTPTGAKPLGCVCVIHATNEMRAALSETYPQAKMS